MNKACEIGIFICIVDSQLCPANTVINILLSDIFILIHKIGYDLCDIIPCEIFLACGESYLYTLGIMVCKFYRTVATVTAYAIFFFEEIYEIFLFGIGFVKILYPKFSVHKACATHDFIIYKVFTGYVVLVCNEIHKLLCVSPEEFRCSARCRVRYGKSIIVRLKFKTIGITHKGNIRIFQRTEYLLGTTY